MDAASPEAGFGEEPSSPERRNWAELPTDCLSVIFGKIGAIEILMAAQSVCRPWRQLAREPQLWRCIDMTCHAELSNQVDMESMAREAVDRSNGQVEAFWAEYFGSDELLKYIADRTNVLKSLRLISCFHMTDEGLMEIIKRFSQLEELEISYCQFSVCVYESVGQLCPQLRCFRLNRQWFHRPHIESDKDAFAIANNMHELRHLQIFGNKLTNGGLQAILDKCPHLESLDIRQCFNIVEDGTLRTKSARIKKLRLPGDSIHEYEFCDAIQEDAFFSDDFDFWYADVETIDLEMIFGDMDADMQMMLDDMLQ